MIGNALFAIFCTLVIAAGWYYLTRSEFVNALQPFETPRRNRARRQARRMGAVGMILAAVSGAWLALELRWLTSRPRLAAALLLLCFALVVMMLSVSVDLYLTNRMRRGGGK